MASSEGFLARGRPCKITVFRLAAHAPGPKPPTERPARGWRLRGDRELCIVVEHPARSERTATRRQRKAPPALPAPGLFSLVCAQLLGPNGCQIRIQLPLPVNNSGNRY